MLVSKQACPTVSLLPPRHHSQHINNVSDFSHQKLTPIVPEFMKNSII